MKKVSVIIPVYNVEKYLRACLDSVVNQTLKDIEIICVDDGSTDSSPAILAEYAAKDPRVKVITRPKSNAGAARNAGMAVATGEYLGFVDSDDWCELTLFEKAYETAEKDAADVVFWRFVLCDAASGARIHEGLFSAVYNRETALISYNLAPWSRLVRRDFVLREKLSFQEIARSNDVYFGGMAIMLAQKASVLNEVLYSYRTGQSSSLQANNANTPCVVIEAWARLIEEWRLRKIDISGRIVYSAAFASLFYTLESMRDVEAYKLLWQRIKRFGTDLNDEDTVRLSNDRLKGLWADLLAAETPFDYLVRRQKASSNTISVLWHKLHSCERELESSQRARRINWEDVQRLDKKLSASEMARKELERDLDVQRRRHLHDEDEKQRLDRALALSRGKLSSCKALLSEEKGRAHGLEGQLAQCHVEILSMRSDMKRLLHDLENSRVETVACKRALETELAKRDKRIAEFESSRLCRWALAAIRRMRRRRK